MIQLKTNYNFKKGLALLKVASKSFPNGSGIYKFIDLKQNALYIGKAKNLKKRITSYLNDNKQSKRIKTFISLTNKIEFIKTPTESDSLILESNLIKSLRPPFNIRLMDDKSYPYILITSNNKWPRITKFRGKQNTNDTFFWAFCKCWDC